VIRRVHVARVLCLLRCVCLVIDEPRARCCFQGMEVDCTPEDLSKCSYEERCLEVKDMRLEAEAVVNDVLFAVSVMHVSHSLTSGLDVAYINVETREGTRYCLELTKAGLRVSGAKHVKNVFILILTVWCFPEDGVHMDLSTLPPPGVLQSFYLE